MISTKTKKSRRLISALLALIMLLSMIPLASITASASVTGNGSKENPYVVDEYVYLQSLMLSAPTDGTTRYIKLNADINRDNALESDVLTFQSSNQKVEIDLNGYKIFRKAGDTNNDIFRVNGQLTIRDTSSDKRGKVSLHGVDGYCDVFNIVDNGSLTVESGTYYSEGGTVIRAQQGKVVINGGKFQTDTSYALLSKPINTTSDVSVAVNGGEFISNTTYCATASFVNSIATINGGTFTNSRRSSTTDALSMSFAGPDLSNFTINACDTFGGISVKEDYFDNIISPNSIMREDTQDGKNYDVINAEELKNAYKLWVRRLINKVAVTDIDAPAIDSKPDMNVTVNVVGAEFGGVSWYDMTADKFLTANSYFELSHSYVAYVTLYAEDDYAFETSNSNMNITFNGNKGFLYGSNYGSAVCAYSFDSLYPSPVITTQPKATTVITEGEGFSLHVEAENATSYEWYYRDSQGNDARLTKQILFYEEGTEKTDTLVMNYFDYFTSSCTLFCRVYGPGGYTDSQQASIVVNPVSYDLWVAGERVTSENKRSLCGGWARYYPNKNRLTLNGSNGTLYITNGTSSAEIASDETAIPGGSAIYYYVPQGVSNKPLEILFSGNCIIQSNSDSVNPINYAVRTNGSDEVIIKGSTGKSDKLSISAGYAFQGNIGIENCTVDANAKITSKSLRIKNADVNANATVNMTSKGSTISVYGNSNFTMISPTLIDEPDETVQQVLYPADSSRVYVGNSADGTGAVLWNKNEELVFNDYDYVSIQTIDDRIPAGAVLLNMDAPKVGEVPPVPSVNKAYAQYVSSITYNWYLYDGEAKQMDSQYLERGKTYRIYVTMKSSDGYCFAQNLVKNLRTNTSFDNRSNNFGVEYYNAGDDLGFWVSFTMPSGSTGVNVSGNATSFSGNSDDVIIQLIKKGMSEASYEAVVKGNNASYSISDVEAGAYTMRVMKKGHVTRDYGIRVNTSDVEQNVKICLLGDVDKDGAVSVLDATLIQKYAARLMTLDDYQTKLADVDRDSSASVLDATKIQKYKAGLIGEI